MASVHTALGPGEVVETKTVRGRTEYRVAGDGFDKWFDGTKIGFAEVDHGNSVDLPYDPRPQYGVGALTDSTIQPIHEIDAEERTSPADSLTFDNVGESEAGDLPGPASHLFAAGISIDMGAPTPHQSGPMGLGHDDPETFDYAHPDMVDHDDPRYQNNPAYQGGGGFQDYQGDRSDTDPYDHGYDEDAQDAAGPLPVPDHSTAYDRGEESWNQGHLGYRQADVLEGAPQRFQPNFIVNDTDDEFLHDEDVESDDRETTDPEGIVHFSSRFEYREPRTHRQGAALLAPLAESILPTVARGVAGHEIGNMLGGDEDASQDQGAPQSPTDAVGGAMDQVAPDGHPLPIPGLEGTGWGDLTQKRGHNLGDRYAEIDFSAAYHNDPVAQFRHDPAAFINRVGYAESEGLNPRMAQYGELIEADEMMRTAAWKDVREKAVRLRREGRVHVKDVGDDRIYASVQGDHGTYDVMIKKGGAFAGFGGGHAVSNWHCGCEWGKWAFKRQFTMIGRLCSHGLASYHEMQSQHLKGVSQKRKRVNPRNARVAYDQTEKDWTVDGDVPTGDLNKLRQWAEQPHDTWNGHQQEHNDDVRETIEHAREEGVDTDQLVASLIRRHAAPDLGDLMGVPTPRPGLAPGTNVSDPSTYPGVSRPGAGAASSSGTGSSNSSSNPGAGAASAKGSSEGPPSDPTGGLLSGPIGQGGGGTPSGSGAGWGLPGAGAAAPGSQSSPPGGTGVGAGADNASVSGHSPVGQPGGGGTPGVGDSADGVKGDAIGGGDYKIQSGDTLGDIAQRSGYGGDYQELAQQNGISDPNKINAGDSIKIGDPKAGGGTTPPAQPAQQPGASQQTPAAPAAPADGGITNPALNNPASPASTPAAPVADTGAIGGASSGASDTTGTGKVNTEAASGGGGTSAPSSDTSNMSSDVGTPKDSATGSTGGGASGQTGMDSLSSGLGGVSDAISSATNAMSGILGSSRRELMADRDWFEAAYPDEKWVPHKPFNGTGGENVTEWGQSKDNVEDNYADNREDPTEIPKASHLEDMGSVEDIRKNAARPRGIQRAGDGPHREPVQPVVVRERRPRNAAVAVEAHVPDFMDFDPLAPRTAASFDDPYREAEAEQHAVLAAANAGPRDIVAEFQANGGGAVFQQAAATSQYDDFSSSPAIRQAMQRTAGRNYSLAEQDALVREGDKGGAGNLGSLDLKDTHYEAMNSVGLW